MTLTWFLGLGIDDRGGHASGYASVQEDGRVKVNRKLGAWRNAHKSFFKGAASGETCMLHARWMTCGAGTLQEAHPYRITRGDKTVLIGIHNGQMYRARDSAKAHHRKYSVDSLELFELIADREYSTIRTMDGYGVVCFIRAKMPNVVNIARLSKQSDLYLCKLKEGGAVWGSTYDIVEEAVRVAGLNIRYEYDTSKVGQVFQVVGGAVHLGTGPKIKFDEPRMYVSKNWRKFFQIHGEWLDRDEYLERISE